MRIDLRTCLKNFLDLTLAPLAPQNWGEMVRVFGFLPPELGGRGGERRVECDFSNSL
jgi:hypothetical protein